MTPVPFPIRVLLVDDHPAVRAGLERLVGGEGDLLPVASAACAREAMTQAVELSPDVAVLDYHLPGQDGLAVARRLAALDRPPRTLLYSAFADGPLAVAARVAGANGIADKGSLGDALCRVIRDVAHGGSAFPPVASGVLSTLGDRLDPDDLPILGMLMHGTPASEIAETLRMAPEWLEARRWAMLERLRIQPMPRPPSAAAVFAAPARRGGFPSLSRPR